MGIMHEMDMIWIWMGISEYINNYNYFFFCCL